MSDARAWLAEVQERFAESSKDASHVVMFDNMDAALADNPAMAAALTAVLDIADEWEAAYREDRTGSGQRIADDLRTAITEHLTKEDHHG